MKSLKLTGLTVLLLTLMGMQVLAAENCNRNATTPPAEQEEAASQSNVPQAQLELMQKREEAKKRTEEMLKLREQMINSSGAGTPAAGQQSLPASQ